MLQTYAKANRKELNQIITIYQSILEFSFEEVGIDVIVKHAKEDVDNMLDDINAKLISVCEEYLKENKIGLDKYQLSMIIMDLYTKTITQLPNPFYVQAKENKNKVKEYVKANKEYSKKLKEVKSKYNELKNEVSKLEKETNELNVDITPVNKIAPLVTEKEFNKPAIVNNKPKQTKRKYTGDTNTLATEFIF